MRPLLKHERLVVGLDPAIANLGMVQAIVDGNTRKVVEITEMKLVKTVPNHVKGGIKNHDRMRRGRELLAEIRTFCYGSMVTFSEIPEGSQSSDAAVGLALVMGVLCACPNKLIEVRPREVKAITGFPTADKERMRQWAFGRFPDAPWKTHNGKRTNDNEHLADALATIEAGLQLESFRRYTGLVTAAELLATPYRRRLQVDGERRRLA